MAQGLDMNLEHVNELQNSQGVDQSKMSGTGSSTDNLCPEASGWLVSMNLCDSKVKRVLENTQNNQIENYFKSLNEQNTNISTENIHNTCQTILNNISESLSNNVNQEMDVYGIELSGNAQLTANQKVEIIQSIKKEFNTFLTDKVRLHNSDDTSISQEAKGTEVTKNEIKNDQTIKTKDTKFSMQNILIVVGVIIFLIVGAMMLRGFTKKGPGAFMFTDKKTQWLNLVNNYESINE